MPIFHHYFGHLSKTDISHHVHLFRNLPNLSRFKTFLMHWQRMNLVFLLSLVLWRTTVIRREIVQARSASSVVLLSILLWNLLVWLGFTFRLLGQNDELFEFFSGAVFLDLNQSSFHYFNHLANWLHIQRVLAKVMKLWELAASDGPPGLSHSSWMRPAVSGEEGEGGHEVPIEKAWLKHAEISHQAATANYLPQLTL